MIENNILAKIDAILARPTIDLQETMRIILICMRSDHQALAEHLTIHGSRTVRAGNLVWKLAEVIILALLIWVLAGRFPMFS